MFRSSSFFHAVALPYELLTRHPVWEDHCARMVRELPGIEDVFENEYGGFCTTFSRSQDRFDLNELSAGLGERFETMGVALKFYACVGSNHTTLDALRDIETELPKHDVVVLAAPFVLWPLRPRSR